MEWVTWFIFVSSAKQENNGKLYLVACIAPHNFGSLNPGEQVCVLGYINFHKYTFIANSREMIHKEPPPPQRGPAEERSLQKTIGRAEYNIICGQKGNESQCGTVLVAQERYVTVYASPNSCPS